MKTALFRLLQITDGLHPVAQRFSSLQGQPIGIVSWHGPSSGQFVGFIARFKVLARCYARLRNRQHACLSHLCREHNPHPWLLPAHRGADPLTWQVVDQVKYLGLVPSGQIHGGNFSGYRA